MCENGPNLNLLEHLHLNSRLQASFGCGYSTDNRMFILTEIGVYVLGLIGCMDNLTASFSFRKDLIKLSRVSPTDGIDVSVDLKNLAHFELYSTVLQTDTVNIEGDPSIAVDPKPIGAMWSPRGLVGRTGCVLAVVTSLFNLELYVKVLDDSEVQEYVCIAHASRSMCEHYSKTKSWPTIASRQCDDKDLMEFMQRADSVIPTGRLKLENKV